MTRWLVTGASGMLGRDVVTRLRGRKAEVVALDRAALDVTSADHVREAITSVAPDVVVNCAAWTDVDGAEAHEDAALAVNGGGARNMVEACKAASARLLHVSTDYVFPGDGTFPYREDAPTEPINSYGRTKLAGEQAVIDVLPTSGYIVRTAWLYGEHGHSFVRTMVRLESELDTVSVVDDQRGQPTWSADLAGQLIDLGEADAPAGVYHGTNGGETTWFELAREVFRALGADPERVQPTTSDAYPRPARRPAYSVLAHDRWVSASLKPMRDWRSAASEAIPLLAAAWRSSA